MRAALLGLLWLYTPALWAGEVLLAHAGHDHGLYSVEVDMRLDAPRAHVWRVLTDYQQLYRLNEAIVLSEVMLPNAQGLPRVRVITRACVYFFCKTIIQVQDVREQAPHRLMATVLPEMSHFQHGVANAQLWEEGAQTRLRIVAEVIPDFWVPPIIGPWLIARKLRTEAMETLHTLEQLCEAPVAVASPE